MSNILDPLYLLIMFGVFTVAVVIGYSVLQSVGSSSTLVDADVMADAEGFYDALNAFGVFIIVAIILSTIGAAYLIKTIPIFFAVALILLFVQLLVLPMLVGVFNPIIQGFAAGAAKFDLLIWLVQISPAVSFIGGMIAGIVALRGEYE